MDGQGARRRRKIAENFHRLSRVYKLYRRQTYGTAIAYSERKFTFAKNYVTEWTKVAQDIVHWITPDDFQETLDMKCGYIDNQTTHTHVLWPLPEEIFFWTCIVQRKITGGSESNHPAGRHFIRTNKRPTSIKPLFVRLMPFRPQPSHFILAWDRHQIWWLAYPLAWFIYW